MIHTEVGIRERRRNLFFDSKAPGLVISSSYERVRPARKRRVNLPPPLFSPLQRSGENRGSPIPELHEMT